VTEKKSEDKSITVYIEKGGAFQPPETQGPKAQHPPKSGSPETPPPEPSSGETKQESGGD